MRVEKQGDVNGSSQTSSEDQDTVSPSNNGAAEFAWTSGSEKVSPRGERKDVIERGLLSIGTARQLVELYKTQMYPVYPIVYIDPACTADTLRRTKPTLFLAIIAAAAGKKYPNVAAQLDLEVLEEYANRTVVNSEKSLELVQSLNVSAVWYQPPGRLNQIKFYEYVHMAAMMVAEIGIGTRPLRPFQPPETVSRSNFGMPVDNCEFDAGTTSIESRRTLLATHASSAGVMVSMRRPAMMRITSYTHECLEIIDRSPHAAPSDIVLTAWVRLLIIADEIASSFVYDDQDAIASILDVKTQLMIAAFEKRLSDWHRSVPTESLSPTLRMMYYTTRLYLHEVALHVDHSSEDFKAPYHMGSIYPSCKGEQVPVKPIVEAILELVESAQALMDVFLSIDVDRVRILPVASFVRISYAAFVLAKLSVSAASKYGHLAPLIDRSSLKAQSYLSSTLLHLRRTIGPDGCRVPAIFVTLLSQMGEWCSHPELIQQVEMESSRSDSRPEASYRPHKLMATHDLRTTAEISSQEKTSETVSCGRSSSMSAALTGSFEANYASIAGEEIVNYTAALGLASQEAMLDSYIPDSQVQLGTPLSTKEGDRVLPDDRDPDNSISGPAESTAPAFGGNAQVDSWPLNLDQMSWDSDIFSLLVDKNPHLEVSMVDWDALGSDLAVVAPIDEAQSWQPT